MTKTNKTKWYFDVRDDLGNIISTSEPKPYVTRSSLFLNFQLQEQNHCNEKRNSCTSTASQKHHEKRPEPRQLTCGRDLRRATSRKTLQSAAILRQIAWKYNQKQRNSRMRRGMSALKRRAGFEKESRIRESGKCKWIEAPVRVRGAAVKIPENGVWWRTEDVRWVNGQS